MFGSSARLLLAAAMPLLLSNAAAAHTWTFDVDSCTAKHLERGIEFAVVNEPGADGPYLSVGSDSWPDFSTASDLAVELQVDRNSPLTLRGRPSNDSGFIDVEVRFEQRDAAAFFRQFASGRRLTVRIEGYPVSTHLSGTSRIVTRMEDCVGD